MNGWRKREREGGREGRPQASRNFLCHYVPVVFTTYIRVSLGARAPSPGGAAPEARTRIMAKVVVNLQEPLLPEPCAPDFPEAGVPVCFGSL